MKAVIEITEQMEIDHALCSEDSDCEGYSCCIGTDECIYNYLEDSVD